MDGKLNKAEMILIMSAGRAVDSEPVTQPTRIPGGGLRPDDGVGSGSAERESNTRKKKI